MKTIRPLTLTAATATTVAAIMLAGCSKEPPTDNPAGSGEPIEVRFTGNVASLVTRVGGADGTVWDTNDPVGIYMFKANGTPFTHDSDLAINKRHIATAGTSATFAPADGTPLYYPTDGSGVKFLAFHPQGGSITSDQELMFSVASQADLSAIDVLHAPLTAAYDRTATAAVPLAFEHKLSKLVFNVANGAGVTEPVANGMTVAISGQKTTGELHLITGAIEVTGTAGTLTATASAGATTIEAIVIPSSDLTDVTFTFTNNAGQEFDVEVPTAAWEGGKRYTYTVTLKAADKRADISGTIDPWGDGGTEAVDGNEQAAGTGDLASGIIKMKLDATPLTRAQGRTISFGVTGEQYVNINWGDGTTNTNARMSTTEMMTLSHTYAEGGEYEVTVAGEVWGLDCSNSGLIGLDFSMAPGLVTLNCSGNPIVELSPGASPTGVLDLSDNTAVVNLEVNTAGVTHLDVSGCTVLETLKARGTSTGMTSLDVRGCTALKHLDVGSNSFATVDVSTNGALEYLDCSAYTLETLDVGANPKLQHLDCGWGKLVTVDTGNNPVLHYFGIENSPQLTELDLSGNPELFDLVVDGCDQLTGLDLSNNTQLSALRCSRTNFGSLDLSSNSNLSRLECADVPLMALDLSGNTGLRYLDCSNSMGGGMLTSLDISHTTMEWLDCSGNKMTSLDLPSYEEVTPHEMRLRVLLCRGNSLERLDVRGMQQLQVLLCNDQYDNGSNASTLRELLFDQENRSLCVIEIDGANINDLHALFNSLPVADGQPVEDTIDMVSYRQIHFSRLSYPDAELAGLASERGWTITAQDPINPGGLWRPVLKTPPPGILTNFWPLPLGEYERWWYMANGGVTWT